MLITAFIWDHISILNMPEIKIYTSFGSLISQPRKFSSVAQSCLTLCDPMDRLNCPSPIPGVYSNSCPWSWWFHPSISSSVIHFSSCLQAFPASGSFQMSQLHQVAKVLKFQIQHHPSNEYSGLTTSWIEWLDLLAVQGTLKSLLQHHSSKHHFFSVQPSV